MPEPVLDLRGVACERDDRVLFEALDLAIGPGEAVQLRGANGAGKTTLLRCIAGLYPDHAGTVRICGDASGDGRERLLFLGHRPGLSAALTAGENLVWVGALDGVVLERDAVAAALARVGLAHWDNVPCAQMSAGQQRRVALARLVLGVGTARLWLLDEPFTALDDAGIGMVVDLMREQLAAGGAVLFATHQSAPGLAPLATLRMEGGAARLERAA